MTSPTPATSSPWSGRPPAECEGVVALRTLRMRAKVLWCCHVLGPDDVHPAPTYEAAQDMADQINAFMERRDPTGEDDILSLAIVAPWPWDPESHATALSEPSP